MKKGFTLIELVVVIALISILAVTLAPKVLTQINKSKVSRVLQELSDIRRDFRIAGLETNINIESVGDIGNLLQFEYITLETKNIPENSLLYSARNNIGGWLYYEDELYANLPNGAYTGDEVYEIWNFEDSEGMSINVDRALEDIITGDKDDTVVIDKDVDHGVDISTGDGNDKITIEDSLRRNSLLDTGDGNDTVEIGILRGSSALETGAGDDSVTIGNVAVGWDKGRVDLGDGNDTLTISDPYSENHDKASNFKGTEGVFDGGNGNNTLILKGITSKQWDNNENNIRDRFKNFGTIIFQ